MRRDITRFSKLIIGVVLTSAYLVVNSEANAGPIGPGDFQGNETVQDYSSLGLPLNNSTPIVIGGDTYTTDSGTLRYFTVSCVCIGTGGNDLGYIDIVLDVPALRAGVFIVPPSTFATVSFFDEIDTLLGEIDVSLNDDPLGFAGFEADNGLISRIRILDTAADPFLLLVDDLTVEVATVVIDIKPGSDPNSINPYSSGKIPVAVLTTDTFDAVQVDPLSVAFGPNGANESHGRSHVKDVDDDGDVDLVLHFNTQETGIQCGDTDATLTGETFGGEPIAGSDAINTVNCP